MADQIDEITVDIVIPSIRLDTRDMLKMLGMNIPKNIKVQYYVISDNPQLQTEEFTYNGNPIHVIVNTDNLGAPLSRNVGLDIGTGQYVLFIDDDVIATPNILYAYLEMIKKHPEYPGYIGPTIFPDPVNSFTRGVLASGMLTFFILPSTPRQMSWGTTSNLMIRRSVIGNVRFSKKFPKHGGGEDIDFCLRIMANNKKQFITVPKAEVHHPWWRNARRSYVRFFRWSMGDSRLVNMHPQYAYYDVPDIIETLIFGTTAISCLALVGIVSPIMIGIWIGLIVCAEFVVEQFNVRSHHPKSSIGACIEAAVIRISSELGRFFGPLSRRDISYIFKRFDYISTGEWMAHEKEITRTKFVLFSASVPISYGLSLLW